MTSRHRTLRWAVPLGLLGLFFSFSMGSALRESITYDESIHLAAGYSFWRTGFYNLDLLHPPLLRLWASLPLHLMHAPWPTQAATRLGKDAWLLAYVWLFQGPKSVDYYLLPARVMVILLGIGLGALVWIWAERAYGTVAAIASLIAYSFCPILLAYSHYVTTDFAPAAASTLVLYIFWLHSQRPATRGRFLLEGALLGLAVSTKFSELIMLPLIGMILFMTQRQKLTAFALGLQFVGFAAMITLAYGVTQIGSFFTGLHWLSQVQAQSRLPQYFHGAYTETGWPWFLSALFFLKTPIPFLALVLGGAFLARDHIKEIRRVALVWWLFPCLFYLGVASLAHHQLGIRRILLLYPLLSLWIGWVVSIVWKRRPYGQAFCTVLFLWYAGSALRTYPYFISYYNEGVGGGENGNRYAVDCNLDWGQGVKELAAYLKGKNVHAIYFSYFGGGDPLAYGIHYVPVAGVTNVFLQGDPPSILAGEKQTLFVISATNRVSLYYRDHHLFEWLSQLQPVNQVADTFWIYDITGKKDVEKRLLALRYTPPLWASPS